MPSKRHGYLTRKEWLSLRLQDQRDRAGAFDVERMLRSLARKTGHRISTIEARIMADIRAQGYSLQIEPTTPEQRAARKSPNMRFYYLDTVWTDLDECANGFLCHNYFPIGDPVGHTQLMRCERCGKEYQDDCQ